jgi:hypothetical protein
MCPTALGRTQTRTATLWPAILGLILSLVTGNEGWIVLIGIFLLMVVLDILVYPLIIKRQPPWLTFVIALAEFGILYVLSQALQVGLQPAEAIAFYWVSWIIANWTTIVILSIVELTWIEIGALIPARVLRRQRSRAVARLPWSRRRTSARRRSPRRSAEDARRRARWHRS